MTRPHDSWAEAYDLAYEEEFGALYAQLTRLTVDEIGRLVAPPASIVDFGAGTGRLAIPLARAGYRVTAVEPSGPMLQQLRSTAAELRIPCIESTMQDFHAPSSFDLALCVFTVVLYLLDEAQLREGLLRAGDCLKPGGRLLLDVPSQAVFTSHGCRTQRVNRTVTIRPIDGDLYEYCEELELLGKAGVEEVFRDRFMIRSWDAQDVIRIARHCGFELAEDLSERFAGSGSDYYLFTLTPAGLPSCLATRVCT